MNYQKKEKNYGFDPNHDYFARANLAKYENEWVAISGQKVVAHGKSAKVVYYQARKIKPRAEISLAKILPQKPLILSFFNDHLQV